MGLEKQLSSFFSGVGSEFAPRLELDLKKYIPLMKKYPEIVKKNIHRFGIYFTQAPAMNHQAALRCLINIVTDVPEVRDQITKDLSPILEEWRPMWEGSNEGELLHKLIEILELPLPKKDEQLKNIARSIITLQKPIILVIGAGFSYDTLPITDELQPLLISLLRDKGISSPAQYIRNNNEKVWNIVKENSNKFKDMFIGWCAKSKPSIQHEIVAEMFHDGMISHIISFNWDNLIERSYIAKFGQEIPKITSDGVNTFQRGMWKLHGDVEDKASKWVFPYEKGYVFESLISSILKSVEKNCPQYALIVGYSEWEEAVRKKLIKCLEENVPTIIRVRPNLPDTTDGYISETSKIFFQHLRIYLEKERKS